MNHYRKVKIATGMNGSKIKIGDYIEAYDFYEKKWSGIKTKVIDLWHQGQDGIIAKCETAPLSDYPHYFNHRISQARKIS